MLIVELEGEEVVTEVGLGRCGWGAGSLGRVNCMCQLCVKGEESKPRRTAFWAGYCRGSAMWSEDSFTGRESSAVRNCLQNVISDMVGDCAEVCI